jgi:hypothetical protein
MTVNFLDKSAFMAGLDLHTYCPAVPPGAEIPAWPYLVGARFSALSTWWKLTEKSTSQSNPMVRDGWSLRLVPHVPVPAPPGPKQALEYLGIVVTSGSEPLLTVASVTGEGSPLAVCLDGCAAWNMNCGPFESDMLTGFVLCFNSVKTTPSLSDVVGAIAKGIAGTIVAPLVGYIVGKKFDGLGIVVKEIEKPLSKYFKKAYDKIAKPLVEFLARQIASAVFGALASAAQWLMGVVGL